MPRVYTRQWKPGDLRIHPGSLDDIPLGWELAEDMIDRAVVGAGGVYGQGEKFGSDAYRPTKPSVSASVHNRTLSTSQIPSHRHTFVNYRGSHSGSSAYIGGDDSPYEGTTQYTTYEGGSSSHNHGVSVSLGEVGEVNTRQQSIAVIWIRKL